MSYNGSGTFNINTAGQPVVTGTTITSTAFNLLTADLASGLTTALTKDGQTTPTANIPMGTFKITGLGAGSAATDAAQYGQLQAGATTIATVTGTDALTGTLSPAPSAYATGNLFSFVAVNTNTGPTTINLNSLGVKSITKSGSAALVAGDIVSGRVYLIEYDGTQFQLIINSATATSVSDTLNTSTGAFQIPQGTTAQRPASPLNGMTRINNTTNAFEIYSTYNSNWNAISTFTNVTPTVEYLVVAGGGGAASGGAGAGGYRTASGFTVAAGTPLTVTVGAGGTGAASAGTATSGSTSTFSTINASGGGKSSADSASNAATGGSGGGGGGNAGVSNGAAGNSGGYTPVEGYAGGGNSIYQGSPYPGGGGGGSSAAGSNATGGSTAGNGGAGTANSISGSSVTYAGGGGGGVYSGGTAGTGGAGGGGAGSGSGNGTAGTANTGGGGGGCNSASTGGNGGSGTVIIRYPDSFIAATATTGSPTITVAGGYRVYAWTALGSITF